MTMPMGVPPVLPPSVAPAAPALPVAPGPAPALPGLPAGAAPAVPPPPIPLPLTPPPATPAPAPPTIGPDSKLKPAPPPPEKMTNPFERTAAMIVQSATDQAKRLAANLGEHATSAEPADPSVVHEMFHFSKYGADAPRVFWQKHDELLQLAMANNDPDPYAVAERGALADVYPYREKIALLDHLNPAQKVARAEELLRISHGEIAKGTPPTALPSVVGPHALPPPAPGGE